jgi:hypothetical protein
MCWASNHQNIYRNGPRAHFPFNIPFLVIYANTLKATQNATTFSSISYKVQIEDQLISHRILAYLDHFCPHLVYFHKTNSFSYLYVKNTCFGKSKDLSRLNLFKYQKLPLFP